MIDLHILYLVSIYKEYFQIFTPKKELENNL